jgi:hypothetical protein
MQHMSSSWSCSLRRDEQPSEFSWRCASETDRGRMDRRPRGPNRPRLCENAATENMAMHFQPRRRDIVRFVALESGASASTRRPFFVFTQPRPEADGA